MQNGDYNLVVGATCHHKRAHGGPNCSPPKDYQCFLGKRNGPGSPSEVVPHKEDSIKPSLPPEKGSKTSHVLPWKCQLHIRKTEVCMFLSRMMTTNWSWEPFVLIRRPKEGQIAPPPRITYVF